MFFETRIGELAVELVEGDIATQPDFAVVVNAANAELLPGGGVAGALHRGAGPGLADECAPLAPIAPGECVLTGGHDLPNESVIHCLGPVYGLDTPAEELLASCYRRALELAEAHALRSIAFPAISTGAFGYPLADAAEIALRTVVRMASRLTHVRRVRFVLADLRAFDVHRATLRRLTPRAEQPRTR